MKQRVFSGLILLETALVGAGAGLGAEREPVLKQIQHPHPYYYREMYLPQLTTGPSSVAWMPGSEEVVYSMGGGLWRQRVDGTLARQITAGPGYDYQPDVSPDGRFLVYAKYDRDAVELWRLDLETGRSEPLTEGGHVNVEPRWSPDGRSIAFVSTRWNGRFHIFLMEVENGRAQSVTRLTGETRTEAPRYYYGPFDHEIHPSWSPDGEELLFVSNRGRLYGTGGFWRMRAEPGAEAREIHYEETTWKARPDWSPDGKRIVYSSYLGRQWHQLWLTTPEGGDPFPITYGDFDDTAPRWSSDGRRIAFISNREGNPSLWIQEVVGGRSRELEVREREYLRPMGSLAVSVLGEGGRPVPARISVTGSDGRAYAPEEAWIHADDSFVRGERPFEAHYFHAEGTAEVTVPAGRVEVEAMRGFENRFERRSLEIREGERAELPIRLSPLPALAERAGRRWISGDLHVHMNYGGAYRNTPERLRLQAGAEDVAVVHNLIVNKEQRIPDVAYFRGTPDPVSGPDFLLLHDQEFHTSYWGHLGLLGLTRHLLIPDYAAYPNTAAASLYPTNAVIAELAREQGALVGYVHPYDEGYAPDPDSDAPLHHALVVDVALGNVDYLEVLGFSDHRTTASVWYRFLNCGFRIPAGAGTDAMANFASLRGPLGMNRVYVAVPSEEARWEDWKEGLKQGRTVATNGPLLDLALGDTAIGEELELPAPDAGVPFTASLRSIVPIENWEIVCNGRVARRLELGEDATVGDVSGRLPIEESGWCVARAWNEGPAHPVLDAYPYATTSPIYVTVAGERPRSPEDAAFLLAWIDAIASSVASFTDWNTEEEKRAVEEMLANARSRIAH